MLACLLLRLLALFVCRVVLCFAACCSSFRFASQCEESCNAKKLQCNKKCNDKNNCNAKTTATQKQMQCEKTIPRWRCWASFPRNSDTNKPRGAILGCFSQEFLQKRTPRGDSGVLFQGTIETSPRGRFWATFPRNSYRNEPPGAILGCFSKEFL